MLETNLYSISSDVIRSSRKDMKVVDVAKEKYGHPPICGLCEVTKRKVEGVQ